MNSWTAAMPAPAARRSSIVHAVDWEIILGGNWLARVGALALIVGTAFFLKLAFDNDWIGETERVLLGVVGGLALIGAGEYWRRRYAIYSQALAGGGVAILYVSVFAAYSFYDLIATYPAIGVLALISVGAAALALWSETILLSFLLWRIGPGRTRRRVRNALAVVTPLLVLALLALVSTSYADDPNAGVVVADEVTLFSGPGESYIRELTLHSGTEVAIVETRRGWLRIAVPGGETQGWAPGDTIERVSPPG